MSELNTKRLRDLFQLYKGLSSFFEELDKKIISNAWDGERQTTYNRSMAENVAAFVKEHYKRRGFLVEFDYDTITVTDVSSELFCQIQDERKKIEKYVQRLNTSLMHEAEGGIFTGEIGIPTIEICKVLSAYYESKGLEPSWELEGGKYIFRVSVK